MRAKYTTQFCIEDLFPEPAAETSGVAVITRKAHHQFLTDAVDAVRTYLKRIGTEVHFDEEFSLERVETGQGMDNIHLRPQFQGLYLTEEGIVAKLNCFQEYDTYIDQERVNS